MNPERKKAAAIVLLLFPCLYFVADLFISRFTLSIPSSDSQCLEAKMFLVDKSDKNIKRGDLVAFKFEKEDQYFEKGMSFIKIAAGLENDHIEFTPEAIKVNNAKLTIKGMNHVINALELDSANYNQKIRVKQNEIFVVGETIYSYDSRYWGSINKDSIIGKAYAIF